jgi:predicted transcriptional regulator
MYEKKDRKGKTIGLINEALEKGIPNRKEIAEYAGISYTYLCSLSIKGEVDLTSLKTSWVRGRIAENRDLVDDLILEGESLQHIGNKVGVTKQRVKQYITQNGLDDLWWEAKKERRRIKIESHQTLVDLVLKHTLEKARETDDEEAVSYFLGKGNSERRSCYDLTKLINLVKIYKFSKKRKKGSYKQFAELSGMGYGKRGASCAHAVLTKMGFKPINKPSRPKGSR